MKIKLYIHPIIPRIKECNYIDSNDKQLAINDIVRMIHNPKYGLLLNLDSKSSYLYASFSWALSDLGWAFWVGISKCIDR